jgi:hypothetical protein
MSDGMKSLVALVLLISIGCTKAEKPKILLKCEKAYWRHGYIHSRLLNKPIKAPLGQYEICVHEAVKKGPTK